MAHGVTVVDTLPADVEFVSATASQGSSSYGAGQVTSNLGTVFPGVPAIIEITVTSFAVGVMENTANVSSAEADPVSANNAAIEETLGLNVAPEISSVELSAHAIDEADSTTVLVEFTDVTAIFDGGLGDDYVYGGGGTAVLIGGAGNDRLTAGRERSILVGGVGADRLLGRRADDVLIGGSTIYDSGPDAEKLSNDRKLLRLLTEWSSDQPAAVRRDVLIAGIDGVFLRLGESVLEDLEQDHITGAAGEDWGLLFATDFVDDLMTRKGDLISR